MRGNASDYLAAERTFLAWLRTALALMGFGFVVARFGLFLRRCSAPPSASVSALERVARLVSVLTLVGAALLLTARAATANARGE